LYMLASLSSKGDKDGVNALKINPYAMRDYSAALQKYSLAKLIENVALLKEADLKLKGVNSVSADEGQILKELVLRLMH
jgi:DNA polymerase III subunit delta